MKEDSYQDELEENDMGLWSFNDRRRRENFIIEVVENERINLNILICYRNHQLKFYILSDCIMLLLTYEAVIISAEDVKDMDQSTSTQLQFNQ